MRVDEKYLEQASSLTNDLRDDALADITRAMQAHGTDECVECGDDIPPARRIAAPFANRCVLCQSRFELIKKTNPRPWSDQ